jgi:hypothetical protein
MNHGEADRRYCRCGARIARDNSGDLCTPCLRRAYNLVLGAPAVPPEFWTSSPQLADALREPRRTRDSLSSRERLVAGTWLAGRGEPTLVSRAQT